MRTSVFANKLSDKKRFLAWKKEKQNIFSFLFFRATNVTLPTTQR
jgi:hypothetical protein